jgi:RsiW-degrading membrane proteinase PrsW (M82 family)
MTLHRYFLHASLLLGFGFTIITFYIPFVRDDIFEQEEPNIVAWGFAGGCLAAFIATSELYKFIKRLIWKTRISRGTIERKK